MDMDGFLDYSDVLHCGVYALVQGEEVVYVGKSKAPLMRIYSHANAQGKLGPWRAGYKHRKTGFRFDGIWFRPCMLRELDALEVEMIQKYRPRHNVKDKPTVSLEELLTGLVPMLPAAPEPRQRGWRGF